jgi:hypothetical protein
MTANMTQPPTIAKNCAQFLQDYLGLSHNPQRTLFLEHIVIVAIDFENIGNLKGDVSMNLDNQVGLAILHTRYLFTNIDSLRPHSTIRTRNFSTGSSSSCLKASRKFLFGSLAPLPKKDMVKHITPLIPKSRHLILVGHDVRNELRALRLLNLEPPKISYQHP